MGSALDEAVMALLRKSDDELIEQIGVTARATADHAEYAGAYDPGIPEGAVGLSMEDLREVGRRIFARIERQVFDVFCGTSESDEEDRRKITEALGLGEAAMAAALVYFMTSTLAIAPAIATLIAALLVRRIFLPAGQEVCTFWSEKISAS